MERLAEHLRFRPLERGSPLWQWVQG
jgi:hypothetical protein